MNNKEILLSQRWVLKRNDRERYYQLKDHIKELRSLFQEKAGFALISNPQFIRLDKIPGKSEPWMGITEFQNIEEYQILCYILTFLEDKEIEEQFILSHLTEFVQLQLGVNEDYWLKFKHRKMLVNFLMFCIKEQLIVQDDGNSDNFIQDQYIEVLFENTGLSRYFMRNFMTDVFEWKQPEDVMNYESASTDSQDRGITRIHRVYRRLLLSCGIYKEDDEKNDDFSYIRRYRKSIENDLQQFFPCDLQVYSSSAYLILDEEVKIGQMFPKNNALDELVILCCSQIRKGIKNSDYTIDENEIYIDSIERVKKRFRLVIQKNLAYLPSTYRQKKLDQLTDEVYNRFIEIGFMIENHDNVEIYPVVAKIIGEFEEEES